jgi:hypothetical protein
MCIGVDCADRQHNHPSDFCLLALQIIGPMVKDASDDTNARKLAA